MYDPITDSFTEYTPIDYSSKKVKIDLPVLEKPLDAPSWVKGVTEDGKIEVEDNTPDTYNIFEESAKSHYDMTEEPKVVESSSVSPNNKGRQKQAMDYFLSKKDKNGKSILTPFQAAGIVGNLMAESNLDPNAVNPNSGAFGIAQWLGPRKKELHAKYGKNPTFEQQLEFIWYEFENSEKNAFKNLLASVDSKSATDVILDLFERPSKIEKDQSRERRRKFSRNLLS